MEPLNCPRWYGLTPRYHDGITIELHQQAWKHVLQMATSDAPVIQKLASQFKLETFRCNDAFGFGKVLEVRPDFENRYIRLDASFTITPNRIATTATLQVLFAALALFRGTTDDTRPQLIIVDDLQLSPFELGGHGMNITLTSPLCKFLNSISQSSYVLQDFLNPLSAHLSECYQVLSDPNKRRPRGISCELDSHKYLRFKLPGNDCKLEVNKNRSARMKGAVMYGNNMDSYIDQFTCLSGIAMIHSMYR